MSSNGDVTGKLLGWRAGAPERRRLVEPRFFGGLTVDETARVLGLSERTVKRRRRSLRAWLAQRSEGRRPQGAAP